MLIIDGHNLMGRIRGLSFEEEERSREELLRRVAASKGSGGEQVLVVFDGSRPERRVSGRFGGLRVAYSAGGRTADEEILARLDSLKRKGVTVITSDRDLAERCRARGASTLSSQAFVARLGPASSKGSKSSEKPEAGPEEVDRWLDLFKEK